MKIAKGPCINEDLENQDLLKENSALVTCLSNRRVTSCDHFQVNIQFVFDDRTLVTV